MFQDSDSIQDCHQIQSLQPWRGMELSHVTCSLVFIHSFSSIFIKMQHWSDVELTPLLNARWWTAQRRNWDFRGPKWPCHRPAQLALKIIWDGNADLYSFDSCFPPVSFIRFSVSMVEVGIPIFSTTSPSSWGIEALSVPLSLLESV